MAGLTVCETGPGAVKFAAIRASLTQGGSIPGLATLDLCGNRAGYTLAFQSQRSRRRKVEAVSSRLASRSYVLAMPMSRLEETNGCEI